MKDLASARFRGPARNCRIRQTPRHTSGLLSTAGDLVFGGTADGFFFALDALTGEELWHKTVGGRVHAGPMGYAVDGKQYVAIAAGNAIFSFALPD